MYDSSFEQQVNEQNQIDFFDDLNTSEAAAETQNGYVCMYKSKRAEVYAYTQFEAQQIGAKKLKANRPWEVSVILCEKNGKQVTHQPLM